MFVCPRWLKSYPGPSSLPGWESRFLRNCNHLSVFCSWLDRLLSPTTSDQIVSSCKKCFHLQIVGALIDSSLLMKQGVLHLTCNESQSADFCNMHQLCKKNPKKTWSTNHIQGWSSDYRRAASGISFSHCRFYLWDDGGKPDQNTSRPLLHELGSSPRVAKSPHCHGLPASELLFIKPSYIRPCILHRVSH